MIVAQASNDGQRVASRDERAFVREPDLRRSASARSETLLERKPLQVPSLGQIDSRIRGRLAKASAGLGDLAPLSPRAVLDAPERYFTGLQHRLSNAFRTLNPPAQGGVRSDGESAILSGLGGSFDPFGIGDPEGFAHALTALNQKVAGDAGGLRTGVARLAGDRLGRQVQFPDVTCVPSLLATLQRTASADAEGPAIFQASLALLLLFNAHPFRDGNGRVGRLLFNLILRRGGMPANVYVPLFELAQRSHGGYQIAIRTAELRGDWTPFFAFILQAIEVHQRLATDDKSR